MPYHEMKDGVPALIGEYLTRLTATLGSLPVDAIEAAVQRLYMAYQERQQILIIGNGGSATTASHMACDLAKNVFGQFQRDTSKGRLKVLALTDNIALITAWANDAGYESVFLEQVRTLIEPGDVLVAISGSGSSRNVVEAVKLARSMKASTIGILGFRGGQLRHLLDIPIVVDSNDYGVIEDIHMALNHIFTMCLKQLIAQSNSK